MGNKQKFMILTIILILIILLLILVILWIGKDWKERGKDLERERKSYDLLNEALEQERKKNSDLETNLWQAERAAK